MRDVNCGTFSTVFGTVVTCRFGVSETNGEARHTQCVLYVMDGRQSRFGDGFLHLRYKLQNQTYACWNMIDRPICVWVVSGQVCVLADWIASAYPWVVRHIRVVLEGEREAIAGSNRPATSPPDRIRVPAG